ncbi:metalloregulator ArsR/SmtB family transcription factor [Nocardia sp. 2]|uniref:Metalloregulator ArsR/SmtB family transcription factor n=1 Tax=Nocardia acididurans TaxID=2802282 RepID=A0ABS1MGA8_9NOCA|nr:metalloregulator ArsR/SmtB family transcription factor [Nocardia acididurans]MBL1079296.1 metalloregulator ArsR/SmtB family transcription factor [Nocardia acididurans]
MFEAVFKALADASRRRLLDSLNDRNGQTLRELCAGLDMTRQAVSKHLAVLEAANLVTTLRRGREKLHYLNPEPVNAIADRWINRYDRGRLHALADLKSALESDIMSDEFVYTSYIRTTPEKLWQALTDPAFTKRYWGATFDTDWRTGSAMTWEQSGWVSKDPEQVILESSPYTRLAYTWHSVDTAFGEQFGFSPEDTAKLMAERRSKVAFEIEPVGEMVKLTVVHDGFESGSTMLAGITEGWPAILSNLKTLLETGETLPDPEA